MLTWAGRAGRAGWTGRMELTGISNDFLGRNISPGSKSCDENVLICRPVVTQINTILLPIHLNVQTM